MKTKKFLSFALVLAMLVGMLPGMSLTASAEDNTSEITPTNTSGTMEIELNIQSSDSINQQINDATGPITITLDGPVAGDITIPNDKEITLDLNGQNLNGKITNRGALTITDNKGGGKVTGNVTTTGENAVTTINGGTFKGNVTSELNGTTTINGGLFDNMPTASTSGTVTFEGGYYKTSPTVTEPHKAQSKTEQQNAASNPDASAAEKAAWDENASDYNYRVVSTYIALENTAPTIELTKADTNTEAGKPQVGDTLTAVTSPTNATPVTYQWYRSGEPITEATSKTYVLTADDVDETITVKVSQAANADGGSSPAVEPSVSQPTAAVELKDNTTTPITVDVLKTSISKTDTTISITAPQSSYEYAVVAKDAAAPTDSSEWKSGTEALTFTSLSKGTEYDVLVRAKGDDTTGSKPGVPTKTTVTTNVTVAISAPVAEGVTSTVTIDPTPASGVTYKWFRGDDLTNAISTEKDYVPTADDINKKLTLKIYDAENNEIGVAVFGDDASETVKSFSDYFNEQLNTDPAPDTITLDGPVTGPITIPAGKEITLDLNGKTVTGGVAVNGKAVIKDSTGTGVINGGVTVENGGEVTIESGTVNDGVTVKNGSKATITGGTINGDLTVQDGGTLTVTGGTFSDPDVLKYIDKNDENADVTVKLSKNETLSNSPVTLDIKGKVTIDLNGHTLTGGVNVGKDAEVTIKPEGTITGNIENSGKLNINGGTFGGTITNNEGATLNITNGTFNGTVTNKGTAIIDGGTIGGTGKLSNEAPGTLTVKKGTINVNLENSSRAMIESGTFGGTITNNEGGTLTINGGTFNGDVTNKDTMTVNGGTFASGKSVTTTTEKGKTTINGGTFNGGVTNTESGKTTIKGGQFENKPTASTPGTVSIEGGKFKANPTEANDGVTTVSGKQIFKVEGKDYPYQVADKPNTNAAAVEVSQGETTAEVANTITDADKTDAENTAKSTTADLEEAAVEHVKQIVAASTTVTNNDKNIVIVPALEVKAEAYTVSDSNATMTLDIEATYKSYETVSSITTASQVQTNISDTGKVKEIGSGKLDTTGKAVDVKIVVPDAFAQAMGATTSNTSSSAVTVYVKHTHESKNYEYRAKLYYADSKYFVEFTNPNGFSPFTLSKESESVVTVTVNGENRYYTDMGSALNDIPDGATLTLTKNDMTEGDLTAVITSAKEITIAKGETNNDLSKLNITAGSGLDISKTDNGDGTVTFKTTQRSSGSSSGGSGGYGALTYAPTVGESANGTVSVSPAAPKAGARVTLTATPDAGYTVDTVTVTDANGKTVAVTKNTDGTYSFTQPSGKVKIDVTYKADGETAPAPTPTPDGDAFGPYADLDAGAWYAAGVRYALENGVMSGYGDGSFGPNDTTSRAMLAQILYNLEGKPAYSGTADFTDVNDGDWYAAAIAWASGEGLVGGYGDGLFGPQDMLTREQLVTILYRYAQTKGLDVSAGEDTNILSYDDAGSVSDWAAAAMRWAVGSGLVNGKTDTTLNPQDTATRAEIATIIMRYCENLAK